MASHGAVSGVSITAGAMALTRTPYCPTSTAMVWTMMLIAALQLVRQIWFDGGPFKIAEFVAHDSRLQFGSLNHVQGGTINPQRPHRGRCQYSDFASAFGA